MPRVVARPFSLPLKRKVSLPSPNGSVDQRKSPSWHARIALASPATPPEQAGVDFGILYDAERNSGNDVRRVGDEGMFETLARHNIDVLSGCKFNRIMTTNLLTPAGGDGARVTYHAPSMINSTTSRTSIRSSAPRFRRAYL
jgi:hypothetical protein